MGSGVVVYFIGMLLTYGMIRVLDKVKPFIHKYSGVQLVATYVVVLVLWPFLIVAMIIKLIYDSVTEKENEEE